MSKEDKSGVGCADAPLPHRHYSMTVTDEHTVELDLELPSIRSSGTPRIHATKT